MLVFPRADEGIFIPRMRELAEIRKELTLDGAAWTSNDDVYDAFFHAVGAPDWHGRNCDALATGSINQVESSVQGGNQELRLIGDQAKRMTRKTCHWVKP